MEPYGDFSQFKVKKEKKEIEKKEQEIA